MPPASRPLTACWIADGASLRSLSQAILTALRSSSHGNGNNPVFAQTTIRFPITTALSFCKIVAHRRFGKTVGCINDLIKARRPTRAMCRRLAMAVARPTRRPGRCVGLSETLLRADPWHSRCRNRAVGRIPQRRAYQALWR